MLVRSERSHARVQPRRRTVADEGIGRYDEREHLAAQLARVGDRWGDVHTLDRATQDAASGQSVQVEVGEAGLTGGGDGEGSMGEKGEASTPIH